MSDNKPTANRGSATAPLKRHTFVAYVQDKPGVLDRVASLFRRRGYNIDSLTVGRSETPGVSRMTIVLEANDTTARLMEANLYKLVNVLRVQDVTYVPSVMRDMALIKVRAPTAVRPQVLQVCELFRARVLDVGPAALVVEITGTEDKIRGLVEVLEPFGILEMVRTGRVAMTRGAAALQVRDEAVSAPSSDSPDLSDASEASEAASADVDESAEVSVQPMFAAQRGH